MTKTVKSALCVVALSVSVGAQAAKLTVKDCEDMQELAYKVMNLRQTGVPASQLIALADGNKIANAIVIAAYEELQYNTREYQIRANKEFANRVYIECFKSINK
jgi:hypothetical protein